MGAVGLSYEEFRTLAVGLRQRNDLTDGDRRALDVVIKNVAQYRTLSPDDISVMTTLRVRYVKES
jgi:hypothetical protein